MRAFVRVSLEVNHVKQVVVVFGYLNSIDLLAVDRDFDCTCRVGVRTLCVRQQESFEREDRRLSALPVSESVLLFGQVVERLLRKPALLTALEQRLRGEGSCLKISGIVASRCWGLAFLFPVSG